jgi:hypothetical protein
MAALLGLVFVLEDNVLEVNSVRGTSGPRGCVVASAVIVPSVVVLSTIMS